MKRNNISTAAKDFKPKLVVVGGKKFVTTNRRCRACGTMMVGDKHSLGNLHAVCLKCKLCFDCDDGE